SVSMKSEEKDQDISGKTTKNEVKTKINPEYSIDCLTISCLNCNESCNDFFITLGVLMSRDYCINLIGKR
ncbi:MAG: hypothetical protein ACFFD4_16330, partial [Candidatus Odinarchaeota archaeon]